MAISRTDLLDYAAAKATGHATETELRSSLSRSYYAAFHALLPLLERLPASSKCKGNDVSHFEVMERLREWKVEEVCPDLLRFREVKSRVVRAMDLARAKRVVADYRLGQEVTLGDCKAQIERVKQIVRAADQFNSTVDAHLASRVG